MSGNTFGRLFRLTTYGESHGPALGGVVDGCPAGIALSEELLQKELDRRRPGGGTAGTTRKEPDAVRLLSGVFEGVTTGTPIGFQIGNTNQRSGDYGPLAAVWRPGHADMTYDAKYGVRDFRGGGRSSARETAARVAGGAIARALLAAQGISVRSCTLEIGGMPAPAFTPEDMAGAASRPYCAPCEAAVEPWEALVRTVRGEGDTLGGISTGQPLVMTVAIKPIPSIAKEQQSVNAEGSPVSLRVGGRHDICAIPRVNPVLEAMAALTVADALLLQRRMG